MLVYQVWQQHNQVNKLHKYFKYVTVFNPYYFIVTYCMGYRISVLYEQNSHKKWLKNKFCTIKREVQQEEQQQTWDAMSLKQLSI